MAGFLQQENESYILQENGDKILLEQTGIEFKIVNNLIVDRNREGFITPILNALAGLSYHPFEAETIGLGYFEIGDRVILKDPSGNQFSTIILDIDLTFDGGFKEKISSKAPDQTVTDYSTAGYLGRKITNTEILVDKVNGLIQLTNSNLEENYLTKDETTSQITIETDKIKTSVSEVTTKLNTAIDAIEGNTTAIETVESTVTELIQTSAELALSVEGVGGSNILKNSVGLKGDIREWQLYDSDNALIDARNSGTIDQSSEIENNSESGSAIVIADQFIEQTFATITGQKYTFYCRYKSVLTADISITGVDGTIQMAASATFIIFKYEFVASGPVTTFKIENTGFAETTLSDLLIKPGSATGWSQAPNEVYGKNFRFDKEGLTVIDLNSRFKAVLDNQSLNIYDTSGGGNRIIAGFSFDAGKISNLIAQAEFVVRRYENPSASLRIIPTDDGVFEVIND